MTKKRLSLAVLALAAAETLFWLSTFYYIEHRTNRSATAWNGWR